MKFGKYLDSKARQDWRAQYVDYKTLKDLIKESVREAEANGGQIAFSPRTTSLSVQRAHGSRDAAEESFFGKLDSEVAKIGAFTSKLVSDLRASLKTLQDRVNRDKDGLETEQLLAEAKYIGDEFLALEKYVNLNYMGFHKILKKHDKMMPFSPCRQFYVAHLHQQPWVQGNYSDLLVQLSSVYSKLRGDTTGTKNEDSAQGFVRSTTKYWVHTTDVSAVKHHVLQHLPVFQYTKDDGGGDSQLINSVYLDNSSMELYHGRLDKRPNAIALRLRWYGSGDPKVVFVERKTHRESWKGDESVKERFVLPEHKMVPFLEGEYTIDQAVADLRAKGKSEGEIEKFSQLFVECQKVVDSKQLRPMIRTQYMRTAFQIPFDATVRISLDTNLTMIKENPDDGPTCTIAGRWYRDPLLPVPRTEITRFPHAVLEVKLSLPEGQSAPEWVGELLESGYCTEVHKFSKFIHGTATLLPDMVQAVPYWVDDESVRPSMLLSAPAQPQIPTPAANPMHAKPRKRVSDGMDELTHPLLGAQPTLQLMPDRSQVVGLGFNSRKAGQEGAGGLFPNGFLHWWFSERKPVKAAPQHVTPMRIEPKTFFANERTFLRWLHMAVTIGAIAASLIGFAGVADRGPAEPGSAFTDNFVEIIGMILLPVAILMCGYAFMVFVWRARMITQKTVGYIDDRYGPLCLCAVLVIALSAILILGLWDMAVTM